MKARRAALLAVPADRCGKGETRDEIVKSFPPFFPDAICAQSGTGDRHVSSNFEVGMQVKDNLRPRIVLRRQPVIVGIVGSHRDDAAFIEEARRLGEAVARQGCVLLTGGGPGVMRSASEGAHSAGGLVIGVLPNERSRPLPGYPNDFVDIPIYTGLSDARNVITAKTPHILIALDGGAGTLSEIALALRAGTPVIGLGCHNLAFLKEGDFIKVDSLESVLVVLEAILKEWRDTHKIQTQ